MRLGCGAFRITHTTKNGTSIKRMHYSQTKSLSGIFHKHISDAGWLLPSEEKYKLHFFPVEQVPQWSNKPAGWKINSSCSFLILTYSIKLEISKCNRFISSLSPRNSFAPPHPTYAGKKREEKLLNDQLLRCPETRWRRRKNPNSRQLVEFARPTAVV